MIVYISGPITGSGVMYENIHNGIMVWRKLIEKGYAPICPHMNDLGYIVAKPVPWEEALDVDVEHVGVSDAVYRLPGESRGASMEVAHAEVEGVPVVHSLEELDKLRHAMNLHNGYDFLEKGE